MGSHVTESGQQKRLEACRLKIDQRLTDKEAADQMGMKLKTFEYYWQESKKQIRRTFGKGRIGS